MRSKRLWLIAMALLTLVPILVTDTFAKKGGNKPQPEEPDADPAIAYRVSNNALKVANADGSNQTLLYQDTAHWVSSPSWSHDGDSIAFIDENNYAAEPNSFLWRIDVAVDANGEVQGSNRTVIVDDVEVWWARWSPTSGEIAFVAQTVTGDGSSRQLFVVPATGGTHQALYAPATGRVLKCVQWSPSGDQIAVLELDISNDLWYVVLVDRASPHGTTVVDLPTVNAGESAWSIAWSKTQSNLMLYVDAGGIHSLDLETGDAEYLTKGDTPSWSPDDSQIIFDGRIQVGRGKKNKYEYGIVKYTLESGVKELIVGERYPPEPDWSR